jgi:hypothetical protein
MRRNQRQSFQRRSKTASVILPTSIEQLELRMLLTGDMPIDPRQIQATTKLAIPLWQLYESARAGENVRQAASAEHLQIDSDERVAVTLNATDVNRATAALSSIGFVVKDSYPSLHLANGVIPIQSLGLVAKTGSGLGRFALRGTDAPVALAGSVNSEAGFALEADRVRATLPDGFNGAGQRVGVLSDSYNHLAGAAADVASGDLPPDVNVLADNSPDGADEGRAMLQVIHDIAPGASLAFIGGNIDEDHFRNNLLRLTDPMDGNASIVVDDLVFPEEPMFQDGIISQTIDDVVTSRGVTYFSAAGNFDSNAYESTTFQTASDTLVRADNSTVDGMFYDFNPGAGVDTRQRITVPPGGNIVLSLQWDDPFYANNVNTDLEFYLTNPATGRIVAASETDNMLFDLPEEVIRYQNPSATIPLALDVSILDLAGPDPGRIKYVNYGDPITINEYATNSPTVVPHAAASHGQGVGAVAYFDQTNPEASTSAGPSTILFSSDGTPITAQVRHAPQIASIDGVNNTFFGQDVDGDGKPNFFGTSAAAAHAAAVAALVRQANPTFTPAQVYSRLQNTARDIGPSGFDNVSGYGLINAYRAVYPTITPAALDFSDGFESGALSGAYETRASGSGRILVTGNHGPFSGSKHLTLDSSIQSGGGLNEVTLHLNASGAGEKILSFREREFDDDDNPMPASFIDSSNSDGVALSVDGTNWFRIVSLTGANSTNTYTLRTFDLSAVAAANGITLSADTRIRFQQYGAFPIPSDGFAFDDLSVISSPSSAVPGAPDLMPETDSGISNADNLTNFNNSNASDVLKFNVPATIAGATVTVYADGNAIGSAVASGSSTIVTTSGSFDLVDGVHQFTARQTESGKSESTDSSALAVTIDTTPPSIVRNETTPAFLYDTAPHRLVFKFSESVQDTLQIQDLTVQRVGTGSQPPQPATFTYDGSNSVTFVLNGIVPDGNFTASINPAGVTDAAGNGLLGDTSFGFFFLTADANHDRHVNTLDFSVLAQDFNQQATTFSQGNFNYDGQTNSMDFNALAALFGAVLAGPLSINVYPTSHLTSPPRASLFSDRAISAPIDDLLRTGVDLLATTPF